MTSATRNPLSDPAPPVRGSDGLQSTGRLGPSPSRWNDYRGTAAADDAIALLGSRSLYEIADVDRSRWTIVGVDASLAATDEHVIVHAVDRTVEPDDREDVSGELGVTAFHLGASTRVDQFLHDAFQRVSIRLVSTLATDRDLRVDTQVQRAPER